VKPSVVELGTDVYAYVQPDGTWMVNNAGFVVGQSGVVTIDALSTEARTRAYREAIANASGEAVHTVVQTHSHPDHTAGTSLFGAATVVSSSVCRSEVDAAARRGPAPMTMFDWYERGDVHAVPASVTFSDRLDLHVDDLAIELHAVGHPAHTNGDVVAWVPARSVLFTGDLIFNGGTPFLMGGSLAGWRDALAWLRAFDAATYVPGHGDVFTDVSVIDTLDGYLAWLQRVAAEGHAAGVAPLDLARDLDLAEYASWSDPERIVANLHRAYLELDGGAAGAPLNVAAVFEEMVTFNGGPLHCIA
jgi:cyclase